MVGFADRDANEKEKHRHCSSCWCRTGGCGVACLTASNRHGRGVLVGKRGLHGDGWVVACIRRKRGVITKKGARTRWWMAPSEIGLIVTAFWGGWRTATSDKGGHGGGLL